MDNQDIPVGRFTLKPYRQLLENGQPVPIGRKALDILSVLAKANGALVTKDELMAAVWPKTIVEDNAIQVHVAALRKALGDEGDLLVTVHGMGYQLSPTPPMPSPGAKPQPPPDVVRKRALWAGIAAVAIAVIAASALVAWLLWPARPSGVSVAVLPFVNMSGDASQDYFSDGMTEEITLALVDVKGLKVVARTSAFAFRGKNEDVRVVGRALSAMDVIEGSVRKQGNKLRISAELVRTDTGEHVWTQSYDRELKDVFAVQEDIARAIAAALQAPLGLGAGENLVANRTNDTDAYDDYLRALALYHSSDIGAAISKLASIVKRDPAYAPARSLLALCYLVSDHVGPSASGASLSSLMDQADKAAHEAVRLDPRDATGYAVLGKLATYRGQWALADSAFAKALALDPTNPDVLDAYASLLRAEGRLKQAATLRQYLVQVEPGYRAKWNAILVMAIKGDHYGAVRLSEQLPVESNRNINLALFYALVGQYERAAQTLLALPPGGAVWTMAANRQAADIIRKAPATGPVTKQTSAADGPAYCWVYVFVGAPERLLMDLEQFPSWVSADSAVWIRHPAFAAMRKTERFKQFVRKFGLVDYWRATSWPDLCHPVGATDFACN